MLNQLKHSLGSWLEPLQQTQVHFQLFSASHTPCLSVIYCIEGNSSVSVHFTLVLYNRQAVVHSNTHKNSRLVSLTASLQPVRMSHSWVGGIVPPLRCMHQEAVNPPLPSICLRLLFPAKQTTRFPMRAPRPPHSVLSGHALWASQPDENS